MNSDEVRGARPTSCQYRYVRSGDFQRPTNQATQGFFSQLPIRFTHGNYSLLQTQGRTKDRNSDVVYGAHPLSLSPIPVRYMRETRVRFPASDYVCLVACFCLSENLRLSFEDCCHPYFSQLWDPSCQLSGRACHFSDRGPQHSPGRASFLNLC